jgi:IclR family acetate operon transcriptional repressor
LVNKSAGGERGEKSSKRYQVPNLERALRILEHLASCGSPCGVSDIARDLKLPKNSVFRILVTLHAQGYLERDDGEKTYCLSRKLLSLGYAAMGDATLVEKSLDVMRRLRDLTRETVLLGTLIDNHGVVVEQVPSPEPVKFLINVGHCFPLHTAAPGKAMLAFLPPEEREAILAKMSFTRFNERTITKRQAFDRELEATRAKGYAVDRGEEIESLHCVAAPVFDHRGRPLAAIWITGPSFRLREADFPRLAPFVVEKAEMISRRFGHMPIS